MSATTLIDLMNRSPFQPLEIHLSDETRLTVENPCQIATSRNSASCIIYEDNGDARMRIVAYRNITEIVTPAST